MSLPDKIARTVSVILVPPAVSAVTFACLAAAYQHGSLVHRILVWVVSVLFSGVLQIGYILFLRSQSRVTGYDVPEKDQRTKPYLVSAALSLLGVLVLLYLNAGIAMIALMICHVTSTLLITVINLRWKISAHAMGYFGPLPALVPLFGTVLLWALPFGLLLSWARIRLQVHTIPQVVAGACLGFFFTALQLFIIYSYVTGTEPF